MQPSLLAQLSPRYVQPFKLQLLKWIGNKQRFAHEIVGYFPEEFETYYEPFLGSGAVLATLAPRRAVASDCFPPLMEIWHALKDSPHILKEWYSDRYRIEAVGGATGRYERVRAAYNQGPNGADLLFLCRACYGGVVRFRQADGHMSTPCGVHDPVTPESFALRVNQWHGRVYGAEFVRMDYLHALRRAEAGDLVYCDPPYSHSQAILYGAQAFNLTELLREIALCKARGVFVALSIDGTKRSGGLICDLPLPRGLFEQEVSVNCGRSMLKRFQMAGRSLEHEVVSDRLLLTY